MCLEYLWSGRIGAFSFFIYIPEPPVVIATCFAYLASPVDAVPPNLALLNISASPLPIHLSYNHSQRNPLVKQVLGDDSPSVEQPIETGLGWSVVYVGLGIENITYSVEVPLAFVYTAPLGQYSRSYTTWTPTSNDFLNGGLGIH